ncbi:integrase domain-containing protein, partial [Aeromonas caviae]|uniref:integrase domain-containing protein n=1 Tax=Aeromonas caviae TaxID=648 RepID=UPI001F461BD6
MATVSERVAALLTLQRELGLRFEEAATRSETVATAWSCWDSGTARSVAAMPLRIGSPPRAL